MCNAASPCLSPRQLPKQTEVVRIVHGRHDLGARQQPVGARPSSSGAQRRAAEFSFLRHQWYVHAAASLTSCLSCPHSAVCRVSTEEAAPPLPSCSFSHYENGGGPDITVIPPPQEKPRRNGTRPDETRPTVESLLDELEGSVASPRYGWYLTAKNPWQYKHSPTGGALPFHFPSRSHANASASLLTVSRRFCTSVLAVRRPGTMTWTLPLSSRPGSQLPAPPESWTS